MTEPVDNLVSTEVYSEPKTWQIERVTLWPQERSNEMRLDSFLQQGWEPFAATTSTSGVFTYHLRRQA